MALLDRFIANAQAGITVADDSSAAHNYFWDYKIES